jgi:hypothetical protein
MTASSHRSSAGPAATGPPRTPAPCPILRRSLLIARTPTLLPVVQESVVAKSTPAPWPIAQGSVVARSIPASVPFAQGSWVTEGRDLCFREKIYVETQETNIVAPPLPLPVPGGPVNASEMPPQARDASFQRSPGVLRAPRRAASNPSRRPRRPPGASCAWHAVLPFSRAHGIIRCALDLQPRPALRAHTHVPRSLGPGRLAVATVPLHHRLHRCSPSCRHLRRPEYRGQSKSTRRPIGSVQQHKEISMKVSSPPRW